ncbi:ImmA/IrrE family metallo-endopeptidase [Domibacillus sp. 8LH]|uniref:ImmA/IrrE family metallo-endopeptidase n=1 Tax=Domibacillus sp. 8LH TaxID=3073900 RepID=UPI00316FBE8F
MLILLNENLCEAKQLQEFAHEVCHLLRQSGNHTVLPFPFVQLQEWQAKTFTLHFCMPTFMLEKLDMPFDKRLAVNKAAHLFNVEYSFAEERLSLWEIQMMGVMYGKSPSLL